MDYEDSTRPPYIGAMTRRAVSYALVATVAFSIGLSLGTSGSSASVISRIPFVGDQLDPTPDPNADLSDFWRAWNALEDHFVLTHASSSVPSITERIHGAIEGLANSYDDPYTVFMPPVEAKKFTESISGSFAGVGMELGIRDGVLTVITPLKGSPAERSGILAGDQVTNIDGKSSDGLPIDKAVSLIRGPAGTPVSLMIRRGEKTIEVNIVREIIQVPETDESFDEKTGVYRIALYQFTENSPELFDKAFKRFKESGSRKLILDLRSNPGGYLEASVEIASHFLPRGATVVTEDFGGKKDSIVHTSYGYMDVPKGTKIAVLIDGGSASASEILAGALRDSLAATIIGTKSFGKGSVQTLLDIDRGALKVTVARWVTPSGHWIMGNGIVPDIEVEYVPSEEKETDNQIERATKFLTTGQ